MREITVREFFEQTKDRLALSLLSPEESLDNKIVEASINRPGLAFSGFTDYFDYNRIQLLGETEVHYIQTLKEDEMITRINEVLKYSIPCFVVAKGLSLPFVFEHLACEYNIAILSSRLSTEELLKKMTWYLQRRFAPEITLQGALMDIFGIGIFVTGKSGIGKSELALDLIERQHRLIADDWLRIVQIDSRLIGISQKNYENRTEKFMMNLRGIGEVDIDKLFGAKAVRRQKQIDVQVELVKLAEGRKKEEFINQQQTHVDILGTRLPIIYLPISSGKNVSVLIEVIARNHIAQAFSKDPIESV